MGASSSKSSQKPVDMTPQAFSNLQSPFANVLAGLLGFSANQPAAPTGPVGTAVPQMSPTSIRTGGPSNQNGFAPIPFGGGTAGLGRTQHPAQIAGGSGGRGAGAISGRNQLANNPFSRIGVPQTPPPTFSPTGDTGNVLRGIPQYQGPLTTALTANEQSILDQLMGVAGPGGGPATSRSSSQNFLDRSISGEFIPGEANIPDMTPEQAKNFADRLGLTVPENMTPQQVRDFVDQLGLGFSPDQSLEGFAQELGGAAQTTGYDPNGNNPFVDAAIEAATRPILQNLEETLSRTLPGRFTQAGQFVQPGGSSAFDRAAAILSRGAAQEVGDISSDISFRSFEAERGRQFEAQEGARAREAEALAQELERRGQFGEAARAREAAAIESQLDRSTGEREAALERRFGAIESELGRSSQEREAELQRSSQEREAALARQQEAALQQPGLQQQEIETMLANLQAQGLPRMIEDLGIERGIEQFNTQVNNLLTTLGITAGVTRPVIAQEGSSKSGGFQLK